jgi:hypothetical protein
VFLTLFGWEFFLETYSRSGMFLDYYFSICENHIWLLGLHLVFNKVVDKKHGQRTDHKPGHGT